MQTPITEEILARYSQGNASGTEAAAVREWLTNAATQAQALEWMRRQWDGLTTAPAPAGHPDEPNYEAMLSSLHQRLDFGQPRLLVPQPSPLWRRWAAAAAVAGTVAGSGWLLYSQRTAAPVEAATNYGQTQTIRLPDGSEVILNGHSKLRYATQWAADKPREVWLDGEGYFSVQHQPNHQRFVVHTQAGFSVEVLGTKFTVNRRRDQARVVLLSGKVRVNFDNPAVADVIMKPGELVETRDAQPAAVVHKTVRTAPYAAWKDARLVLDETTIAEMATRLQDTYGIEVVVESPELNQRKVTGTIAVRDLDVLLLALEEAFHLKATRAGNRLTLSDQTASHPTNPSK
ncbi:FecR domain-containing protein [Hymenobacter sp. BT683]|uniref:FecR domain-containing protein n=1 Tax=Hymenobacter jeongseonensis TaxID=2791027 RepID=A0ABS0IN25_9BACT|nr:FecR domain-containing protein [Hymenobacter jeongseonensis]MBF9239288.1 FecR domain-containing protein [Hymenobacter jeongseonensis]